MEQPAPPDTFTIEVMPAPNRAQRRSEAKRARKVEAWIRQQARLQQAKLARAEARRHPQVEELLRREGWADVASSDPLADVQAAYERLTNDREVKPFVPIEPPADA